MTPLILALDTTGARGSLALARGRDLLEELALDSPDGFGHVIHTHIQSLLQRHSVTIKDVDVYAAAGGPGSFTGVRVGLSCVKGLAEAMSKPVYGISNLRALAWFGTRPLRAPLIDARRGEVYAAVYDSTGMLIVDETVGSLDHWLDTLPPGDLEILAQDASTLTIRGAGFQPASRPARGSAAPLTDSITRVPNEIARALAALAFELFTTTSGDPAALDANYVRRSDAELFWKE